MSLQQWLENSWLIEAERSAQEIANRLRIADRELADASLEGLSPDGRFEHAYAAVRTLCQVALHAAGYTVPKGQRQHERSIESLKLTLGGPWTEHADYFDVCRRQRHQSMYEKCGVTQSKDADELLETARELRGAVQEWLQRNHADLL